MQVLHFLNLSFPKMSRVKCEASISEKGMSIEQPRTKVGLSEWKMAMKTSSDSI